MYITSRKPNESNYGRILKNFYLDSEKVKGKTIWRDIILNGIETGNLNKTLAAAIDRNYSHAVFQLQEIEDGLCNTFIGVYADNNKIIAHTNIIYKLNEEGHFVAEIDGLHIYDIHDLLDSENSKCLKWVYGLYSLIIDYVENDVLSHYSNIYEIQLASTADNQDFWTLIENYGYKLTSSDDNHGLKLRFTKQIEKGMKYERRYPNKQNEE